MAHVWIAEDQNGTWVAHPLAGEGYRLGEGGIEPDGGVEPGPGDALLLRYGTPSDRGWLWALLAEPGVKIRANGVAVETGIRVLRERDLVKVGAAMSFVFSTEGLPVEVPVPEDRIGTRCPRCTRPFEADDVVVMCPRCGTSHHAMKALPCWSYRPRCATCDAPTSGVEYAWTPEFL
jgi:Prokaryotic RING finger family 1